MRFALYLIVSLCFFVQVCAQQQPLCNACSYLGQQHTPTGRLHLLVLFIRYEDVDLDHFVEGWPNTDELPVMARGDNNELFDKTPDSLGTPNHKPNISEYYHSNSQGKFIITADIYPRQIPIKFIPEKGGNFFDRQSKMNQAAIAWLAQHEPDFDWAKYDNRKNHPNFKTDNSDSQADSVLDYVVFIHRDLQGSTGMGATGSFRVPGTPYKVNSGFTSIKSPGTAVEQLIYFKHEFAHNLYGCPHYNCANGTVGNKLYGQLGWGLMTNVLPYFLTANGWERWWLGWLEPQTVSFNGAYTLRDMVTGYDALRLQIPGTQDWLWIENHQKLSYWDNKHFYKEHCDIASGIYMYVIADVGADRNKGNLSPFNPAHCNLLKIMNGQGQCDFYLDGDSVEERGIKKPVWKRGANNPISGMSDLQYIRWDFNGDGKIEIRQNHGNTDPKAGEMIEIWAADEGTFPHKLKMNFTGDEQDAFDLGDEVGLSGIVPVLNYPIYDLPNQTLAPYLLNGISIRIRERKADGTYLLDIRFDDYEIRKNQRWCGNLEIPAKSGTQITNWTVKKDAFLHLDLSGTAVRGSKHPLTQTFANPTRLVVKSNNAITVEKGAKLIIDHYSLLELSDNAQIFVEKGGEILVRNTAELKLNPKTMLNVKKGGKLTVENGGTFRQLEGSYLGVEKGAKVRL